MRQWRPENGATTFDEASLERSKSFVKALQELKNLRPQLYSAAEYCEKSYLFNEQKQLVFDNLKDYAARALINAVDHIGTVAYRLTDLIEQQISDISTVELNISCLNQEVLICQTYAEKEGVRQEQLLATTTRHYKHYTLPNSVSARMEDSSKLQNGENLTHHSAKPDRYTSGASASKTLSWHLASEANSTLTENMDARFRIKDVKVSKVTSDVFHLLEADEPAAPNPLSSHLQTTNGNSDFDLISHPFGAKEIVDIHKPISAPKSSDNPRQLQIYHPAGRNKSMLSAFFAKNKMLKPKRVPVS